uniref:Small ribosomal subunit protein uS17c n=3 Tax=Sargassum TaxID=3015 RepID=A0A8F4XKY8_9PHAE|nr:ribosomal protein S17 [Sargassum polycystum]YP_010418238.1 ribosomal protein S17 [Sargassum plagiophyllum]QXI87458.1 ribosomal protein S17 [Sargassum phyllocystum]QXI87875.1 ribosomal protein S17 [Sargassum mcclurei]QXI88014.1 ribosomal protein S17 [Sargassum henslowianum]QZL38561.1 ribosomal protein S17 [Sargassum ilicifolium var. conduplicatum]USF18361.1 ribosomal protein S17 [Sargassum polycystum]
MVKLQRLGIVISDKMQKSVVVAVEYRYKHQFYSKIVIRTKRYLAHDEENNCNIGDEVIVEESRPLSKRKRWIVKKILNKAVLIN